ncbi:ATP-binding protein [Jatrophihabitans sp. DSM 45814]
MIGATNFAGTNDVPLVRLLGAVQVVLRDGTAPDLPSVTQRRLVAVLALDARRSVRSERLTADLQMSPGSLRTSVSRLRRLLGSDVLLTDAVGYRLEADVDSDRFYVALTRVKDGVDRLAQLDGALDWWRGLALEEFREEPWARSESVRLTELYAAAVEERASELMSRGRWPEAIAALQRHIADHPLRDHPRGLLMQALAGSGRQAEALAVYRTYRAYLAAELGTEPSAEVREIGRQVGRRVDGSARTTTAEANAARAATLSTDLPRYRSTLMGRADDLATVAGHIQTTRLLTLTGVGGVGKTRLAVALAHRANQEGTTTWFVELAALRDPADIVSSIATAVGAAVTDDVRSLASYLGDRAGLLVIDNCEHLLDAAAEIVDTITLNCPNVVVVTTSREFLALEGEQVFYVKPLDPPGAGADLLQARSRAAGTEIGPDDRVVLEEICDRLDGLPLAIEIAATRAGALGLRALRSSLEDSFPLLSDGRRRGAERQQTLGKAIDWSYRLLGTDEQRLFRMLGIFRGGFELDAAAEVATRMGYPGKDVPGLISSLVARSMIDVNLRPVVTRYRILEPLRAFALRALAEAGETGAVARAHAWWIAGLTDIPMRAFYSRASHEAGLRLEREVDSWRAALDVAVRTDNRGLAAALCGAPTSVLLLSHPHLANAIIGVDPLLAPDDERRVAVATAYGSRAMSALSDEDMNQALAVYAQCDPRGTLGARQLLHSGYLIVSTGDSDAALAMLDEAIADPAAPPQTVDYMVGIAIFLACAVYRRDLVRQAWLARARIAAQDSDVPATRLLACRVLASALAVSDPGESHEWTRRALEVTDPLPLVERRISVATWSQLWESESPALAALRMRELVLEQIDHGLGDDQTVLVACASLLARSGHACADDVIATLANTAGAGHAALALPDLAAHVQRGTPLTSEALRRSVLAGLADLAV